MATFDDLKFDVEDPRLPIARANVSFKNGYGASVIFGPLISTWGGHGEIFELAVLKDGKLCYDTPITGDVINNLTVADVNELLAKIEAL